MEMANHSVFYDDRFSLCIELVNVCDCEVNFNALHPYNP